MTHRCTQHRSSPSCTDSRRKMFDFSSQSSCLGRRRVDAPRGLQSAVCNFQRSFSAPSTARRRQHGPYEGRRRASLHDVSAHRPHLARDEQDFRAIAITFPGVSYLKGLFNLRIKLENHRSRPCNAGKAAQPSRRRRRWGQRWPQRRYA